MSLISLETTIVIIAIVAPTMQYTIYDYCLLNQ